MSILYNNTTSLFSNSSSTASTTSTSSSSFTHHNHHHDSSDTFSSIHTPHIPSIDTDQNSSFSNSSDEEQHSIIVMNMNTGDQIHIIDSKHGQNRHHQSLTQREICNKIFEKTKMFLSTNLFPDDAKPIHIFGNDYQLFQSNNVIRIMKFLLVTISMMPIMHSLSRLFGWEHDRLYTITTFFKEDLNNVVMDTVTFGVIGRLYKRKGVDRLFPFVLPMVSSCFVFVRNRSMLVIVVQKFMGIYESLTYNTNLFLFNIP